MVVPAADAQATRAGDHRVLLDDIVAGGARCRRPAGDLHPIGAEQLLAAQLLYLAPGKPAHRGLLQLGRLPALEVVDQQVEAVELVLMRDEGDVIGIDHEQVLGPQGGDQARPCVHRRPLGELGTGVAGEAVAVRIRTRELVDGLE